jgi:hypothetical protein
MKTRPTCPRRSVAGYALLMVMIVTAAGLVILAATVNRTTTVAKLNDRNNQYTTGQAAAEAATEMVVDRIRYDFLSGGLAQVTNNLSAGYYKTLVPGSTGHDTDSFWGKFQFSDAQGHANQTYVACISNSTVGILTGQYAGLYANYPVYRVVSNVRQLNTPYNITNAVQQDLTLNLIPVFQFAIFYNSLLEFSTCNTMTVLGRVHANGPIYVGTDAALTFYSPVTTINTVSSPADNGHAAWTWPGNTTFDGNPGYVTNVAVIQLPLGTNNVITNVHAIIEIPPTSESADSAMGQQRLYNEAKIILLVSNTTATVRIQASANGQLPADDLSPTILTYSTTNAAQLATNLPFLSVTNTFTDQREGDAILVSQIDVGKFTNWTANNSSVLAKFPAGSGTWPNLLYVADNRTYTSSQLTAVRLTNGVALPSNGGTGFTVATPNPLYVWGNYNCPNSSYLNGTNTSASVPAALLSDALTILSPSWKDNQSTGAYTSRNPANTTINAAILTGIVPSTGTNSGQFSGGVHNLPRLLENWSSSITLTLNTSIVNLFSSQMATNKFITPGSGSYYAAPNRNFSFDPNLADASKQPPPGTPNLAVMLRSSWAVPPPNTINYYVTP